MMQILHLWRERANSAQFMAKIVHLRRKKNCFLHKSEEKFCIYGGKRGILYKTQRYDIHRVLTVETLKNRCSNICILRAYGENTCQGPLFGGNKKRNRKTSEAQTKGINL